MLMKRWRPRRTHASDHFNLTSTSTRHMVDHSVQIAVKYQMPKTLPSWNLPYAAGVSSSSACGATQSAANAANAYAAKPVADSAWVWFLSVSLSGGCRLG